MNVSDVVIVEHPSELQKKKGKKKKKKSPDYDDEQDMTEYDEVDDEDLDTPTRRSKKSKRKTKLFQDDEDDIVLEEPYQAEMTDDHDDTEIDETTTDLLSHKRKKKKKKKKKEIGGGDGGSEGSLGELDDPTERTEDLTEVTGADDDDMLSTPVSPAKGKRNKKKLKKIRDWDEEETSPPEEAEEEEEEEQAPKKKEKKKKKKMGEFEDEQGEEPTVTAEDITEATGDEDVMLRKKKKKKAKKMRDWDVEEEGEEPTDRTEDTTTEAAGDDEMWPPSSTRKKKKKKAKHRMRDFEGQDEFHEEPEEVEETTERTEDFAEATGNDVLLPSSHRKKKKKAKHKMRDESQEEVLDEPEEMEEINPEAAPKKKKRSKIKESPWEVPEQFEDEPIDSQSSSSSCSGDAPTDKKKVKERHLKDDNISVSPLATLQASPEQTTSQKKKEPLLYSSASQYQPPEPAVMRVDFRNDEQVSSLYHSGLYAAVNHPRRDRKEKRKPSQTQENPGAYSMTQIQQSTNSHALAFSVGAEVARSRQQRKEQKTNQTDTNESSNSTSVRHSHASSASNQPRPGLHNTPPNKLNSADTSTDLGDRKITADVNGETLATLQRFRSESPEPVDYRDLLRTPSENFISYHRRSSSFTPPESTPDLISAELVSSFDDLGGIRRESIYRQAQEDGARIAREALLKDVLIADEVVDEAALKQRQRWQWIACGVCFILAVVVVGVLGAQPWKSNTSSNVLTPVNDVCSGAIALSSDEIDEGTTMGSKPVTFNSCTSTVISGGLGVWYTIEGTGKPIRVSTCDSNITESYDTQITLFQGTCEDHVCVGGNDNGIDDACGVFSSLTFPSEVGRNYILCVHGKFLSTDGAGGSDGGLEGIPVGGDFKLTVSSTVDNDFCEGAVPLTSGVPIQGSTVDGSSDTQVSFCHGTESSAPGVWYKVEGTGKPMEAVVSPKSTTNFQLTIYEGTAGGLSNQREDCRHLRCIAGYDNPFQLDSQVTFATRENIIYYVLVHGVDGQRGGFELEVHDTVANDLCDTAISIEPFEGRPMYEVEASTELATFSGLANLGASCNGVVPTGAGIWYKVLGRDGTMSANTCVPEFERSSNSLDTTILVFEGSDCGNLICKGGNDDSDSCGQQSSVFWSSTNGTQYYILVSGKGEERGSFRLSVNQEHS